MPLTGTSTGELLTGTASNDDIQGLGGNDTLDALGGNDTLDGGTENDSLLGGVDNDTMTGGAGDDILDGGAGIDSMTGGDGADTYKLDVATDVVAETNTSTATTEKDSVESPVTYTLTNNVEDLTLTGSGAINGTGNASANKITGNTGINTLTGNDGNDTLNGGASADSLVGGVGDDTYIVDVSGDIVNESASQGTDTVQSIAPSYTITDPDVENLTLTGTDEIDGTGNSSPNKIIGNTVANTLDGSTGTDTLEGGTGGDTYKVDNTNDVINENSTIAAEIDIVQSTASYTLTSNLENLELLGTGNIDGTGNGLDNSITGNTGNNILDGKGGSDAMEGGTGNDTYKVDNINDGVTELTGEGTDKVVSSVSYDLNSQASQVENLQLDGSASINATGTAGNNIIDGNSGANIIDGLAGSDAMSGGAGNDTYVVDVTGDTVTETSTVTTEVDTVKSGANFTLGTNVENLELTGTGAINGTGNGSANKITGNTAVNNIDGGAGKDTMSGGAGADNYTVDDTLDVVTESVVSTLPAEKDTVTSSATFTLGANVEDLTLNGGSINGTGNSLTNKIIGGAGDNILDGGTGADSLVGGNGSDTYIVDNLGDKVKDNTNAPDTLDTVKSSVTFDLSSTGTDIELTKVENLTLTGTGAIDGTGNAENNIIFGNTGANKIDGKGGNDAMTGGIGNDTYTVDSTSDTVTETSAATTEIDTIKSSVSFDLATKGINVENLELTGTGATDGTGNAVNNKITGNTAANTIDGGIGNDTMTGGAGDDTYKVDSASDVVTEVPSEGTDTVKSTITYDLSATANPNLENLELIGTGAINGKGNAVDNKITGGTGNNIIDGGGNPTSGAAGDTLSGGTGNDTYLVDNALDKVKEDGTTLTTEIDTVQSSVTYDLSLTPSGDIDGSKIENLTLTGTGVISGTGNALANTITGNTAANAIDGKGGVDTMIGGAGADSYKVDSTSDIVTETVVSTATTEKDLVESSATYILKDNVEDLTLASSAGAIDGTGNASANTITGNASGNTIDGKAGNDNMIGGAGADSYKVDSTSDFVTETVVSADAAEKDTVTSSATFILGNNVEDLTLTGTGAINGTGNSSANTITGNSGINTLDGGTGVDSLIGGTGNDIYKVDETSDSITEASNLATEIDTVKSTATSYTLGDTVGKAQIENLVLESGAVSGTGNTLNNKIDGNAAANTIDGGTGNDTMTGGDNSDNYTVDSTLDVVTETNATTATGGTDTVTSSVTYALGANVENLTLNGTNPINGTGNILNNAITGNNVANIIDGGAGADTMTGNDGNDTYVIDNVDDDVIEDVGKGINDTVKVSLPLNPPVAPAIVGTPQTYNLDANVENVVLTGSIAINVNGTTADNKLDGNTAANTIDGGTGVDTMAGGTGDDIYIVNVGGEKVKEAANAGTDTVRSEVTFTLTNPTPGDPEIDVSNVENLELTGNAVIDGTGNALSNKITGNSAANKLDGLVGADSLVGGDGGDTYVVDNIGDKVKEDGTGNDTVESFVTFTLTDPTVADNNIKVSTIENLTLKGTAAINATGNTLANTITGNDAANTIDGGTGIDAMTGNAGNDTYIVDNASDTVAEATTANEIDTVKSSVTYTISDTDVENLVLTGTGAIDGTGNASANKIDGNALANTIDGAGGADTMAGGAGNDLYKVDNAGDTVTETSTVTTEIDKVESGVSFTLGANVENLDLTGTAANGTGNVSANKIESTSATAVDNVIDGGAGKDTMIGGLGNDTYIVDTADVLSTTTINEADVVTETASQGTDTVEATIATAGSTYILSADVENLTLKGTAAINGQGNSSANTITGNDVANIINGGTDADTMIGKKGDDTYIVNQSDDIVTEVASEGTDKVKSSATSYTLADDVENLELTGTADINGTGNALANSITGNTGANIIDGAGGKDTMTGGLGNDTYKVDDTLDVISETSTTGGTDKVESSATYTLSANVEELKLNAGAGDLNGTGNASANKITGNESNNVIDGGAGVDEMIGGAGADTYKVDSATDVVTETVVSTDAAEKDTVQSSASFTLDANVEDLTLTGTAVINGTGNSSANTITGNAAANTINGGTGEDTLTGGAGNDTYVIDVVGDQIVETSIVSTETDTVRVGFESYTLADNLENLVLTGTVLVGNGNSLNNKIDGNGENNIIGGGAGNDTIIGAGGNDTLNGSTGSDSLVGGAGDDLYKVDSTLDVVTETTTATSADLVESSVTFTLGANVENLKLTGTAAINGTGNELANTITGGGGNNSINGGAADDTLLGGSGVDTLIGGAGNDSLTGNSGIDRFVYDTNVAFATADVGVDIITDFTSGSDKIVLDKTTFTALTSVAGSGFSVASEFGTVITYNDTTGALSYNGVQFADLDNSLTLVATDFVIQA